MSITILQWNLNGVFARLPQLQLLINELQLNVICLQETNFKQLQIINLKNYKSYLKNRNSFTANGGVATFVKETYHSEETPTNNDIELITIKIQLSFNIHICNTYIPNTD